MAVDPRLQADLEALKAALDAYLRHLARSWRPGEDTWSSVATVLAAVGTPASVEAGRREDLLGHLADAAASDTGAVARLVRACGLSVGEELLLTAAWWCENDPQLGSVFGVLHDDGSRRYPSCGLLHLVLAPFGVSVPVQPRHLVTSGVVTAEAPYDRLALTPTARELVDGQALQGARNVPDVPHRLHPMVGPLQDILTSGTGPVTLRGVAGSGRHALATVAAAGIGRTVVGRDRPDAELRLLARMAVAVPVVDIDDSNSLQWQPGDGPLVRLAGPDAPSTAAHVIDVPGPARGERRRLWSSALDRLELTPHPDLLAALSEQFRFTEDDIAAASERARLAADLEGRVADADDVWTAARRQPGSGLQRVATRIAPVFRFDDLVLTVETETHLRELVAQVRHRGTVLDEWGFRRRLPRGRGVAALFSGPPGTGKTTAAEAVAKELSTDLFRVDLSRVVSKYIGETEKNLAVAFHEAEMSGALLLFDEADALFGRRTDVRDAHDRYANLEVSYLLQRVETFTGLVILSTNRPGNIDDALLRRLRFVVRFDSPDLARREELWRRSFPADASVGDLDWLRLAGHDLSGGHIQTAALAAAFLAVADGGRVEQEHVDRALTREYQKLDRAVPTTGGAR